MKIKLKTWIGCMNFWIRYWIRSMFIRRRSQS